MHGSMMGQHLCNRCDMAPRIYTPTTAARVIGIAPNTVRAWCGRYAAHLSPSANPTLGDSRMLTPSDVATLQAIKRLLDADVLPNEIEEQLAQLPPVELQQPDIHPDTVQPAPISLSPSTNPPEAPETAITLQNISTVMQTQYDAMAQRLAAVEQQQREQAAAQADARRLAVLWFIAGVLAVSGVGIVLAVLLGGQ